MKTIKSTKALSVIVTTFFFAFVAGEAAATTFSFDDGIPSDWHGAGTYGVLDADGKVDFSSDGGQYGYVSTNNGVGGLGLGFGSEQNGSILQSSVFSANTGDELQFFFNFVTSDGKDYSGEYKDYAWVRLINKTLNDATVVLFNSRTDITSVTLGGPKWSALGTDSTTCFGPGCGYSGWLSSDYLFSNAGDYVLEFGVVNWNDNDFQSGLAFDGVTLTSPGANNVPEPASLALFGIGLASLGVFRRRKLAE
jgi:hypothetical protein